MLWNKGKLSLIWCYFCCWFFMRCSQSTFIFAISLLVISFSYSKFGSNVCAYTFDQMHPVVCSSCTSLEAHLEMLLELSGWCTSYGALLFLYNLGLVSSNSSSIVFETIIFNSNAFSRWFYNFLTRENRRETPMFVKRHPPRICCGRFSTFPDDISSTLLSTYYHQHQPHALSALLPAKSWRR